MTTTRTSGRGRDPRIEDALAELVKFGLTPSEARVVLTLLRFGTGTASQIAELADVPRQRVYELLSSLTAQRLCVELPGRTARWAPCGRSELVERLHTLQAERLRELQERTSVLSEALTAVAPAAFEVGALPFATVIRDPSQAAQESARLQAGAKFEVLVMNRPPYADRGVNASEMQGLARGVVHRDIYGADEVGSAGAVHDPARLALYAEAGERARLIDSVPIKMVIVDRQAVLMGLPTDGGDDSAGLTAVLIEHAGFASFCAEGFDAVWARAGAPGLTQRVP